MVNVKLIAHRGIHGDGVRENSKQALLSCIGSKADGIEIDVRITADGVCVVHHDTKLATGDRISRLTFKQLGELDSEIIKVTDAIECLKGFDGLINLEVKHLFGERDRRRGIACVQQLSKDLDSFDFDLSRIVVSSFSMPNIKGFSRHLPTFSRAYLAPPLTSFNRILSRSINFGCDAIHVSIAQMKSKKFRDFVKSARDGGLAIRVYTINSDHDFDLARSCDVDAIFTDRIEELYLYQLKN